jgi:hypothetical protein
MVRAHRFVVSAWLVALSAALSHVLVAESVRAGITFSVAFDDPTSALGAPVRALVESHTIAAGQRWANYLVGDAAIDVVIHATANVSFAEGRSAASNFVRNNGAFNVFEQGMAAELRTGVDPNGAAPDVIIDMNPDYVNNELWFDPDPNARTVPVDIDRTDAMSTFLHEFGHALGFAGWINPDTGAYPGDYQSTYDERTTFDGTNFYFTGPEAVALRGAGVPLTFGNVAHVANFSPRPGEDLLLDLMNGLVFYRGSRYDVSPLDVAILRDSGVGAIYRAGDYDVDRDVDGNDFLLWQRTLGSAVSSRGGADGNANGTVDAGDLMVWRTHLGETVPVLAAQSAVPEPMTAALALAAASALARYRRASAHQ